MSQANSGYHHGDLRDALILAAAALIEEQGSLSFSITDAAKRAGVSSAAPYRHFHDKNDWHFKIFKFFIYISTFSASITIDERQHKTQHVQISKDPQRIAN